MISHVKGSLIVKSPESAVIDVGGVGYEVFIPLSTYCKLPEAGGTLRLLTTVFLRDNAIELYGFLSPEEREMFKLLISISGVGPRLARNILSGAEVDKLTRIISSADSDALKEIPGVGKKTAERVILELKDKVAFWVKKETAPVAEDTILNDVISALKNLGYKTKDADDAARVAKKDSKDADFEQLFKIALKILSTR